MFADFTERTDLSVPNHLTFRFDHLNGCETKDLALIVMAIALLTIGILASIGRFDSMGTTQATYLSYGMYGGVASLFIAHYVYSKLMIQRTKQEFLNKETVLGPNKERLIETKVAQTQLSYQYNPEGLIRHLTQKGARLKVIGGWTQKEIEALSKEQLRQLSVEVHALSDFRLYPGAVAIPFFKNHLLEFCTICVKKFPFNEIMDNKILIEAKIDLFGMLNRESSSEKTSSNEEKTNKKPEEQKKDLTEGERPILNALKLQTLDWIRFLFTSIALTRCDGGFHSSLFI